MAAISSSADKYQNIENVKGYGPDKKIHFESARDNFKSRQTRMKLRL